MRDGLLEPYVELTRESERQPVGAATNAGPAGAPETRLLDEEEQREVLGLHAVGIAEIVRDEEPRAVRQLELADQPCGGACVESSETGAATPLVPGTA